MLQIDKCCICGNQQKTHIFTFEQVGKLNRATKLSLPASPWPFEALWSCLSGWTRHKHQYRSPFLLETLELKCIGPFTKENFTCGSLLQNCFTCVFLFSLKYFTCSSQSVLIKRNGLCYYCKLVKNWFAIVVIYFSLSALYFFKWLTNFSLKNIIFQLNVKHSPSVCITKVI